MDPLHRNTSKLPAHHAASEHAYRIHTIEKGPTRLVAIVLAIKGEVRVALAEGNWSERGNRNGEDNVTMEKGLDVRTPRENNVAGAGEDSDR
ncbi:hypothetical protein LTR49_028627 [Elasticomyces elasticus]|nr:hypothetical protein LTR49_028627 [Elasticomyces elasticus]